MRRLTSFWCVILNPCPVGERTSRGKTATQVRITNLSNPGCGGDRDAGILGKPGTGDRGDTWWKSISGDVPKSDWPEGATDETSGV